MDYLPVFLNVAGRRCVVVGGGEVAYRKCQYLIRAGASVCVVAPQISEQVSNLVGESGGVLLQTTFDASCLSGSVLAIAATDDDSLNEEVAKCASNLGVPVNVVDNPALCDFIVPAIVNRDPVVVAISSAGNSPVLTRSIKEINEIHVHPTIGKLARFLGEFRPVAKDALDSFGQRTRFWETVMESDVPDLVYAGRQEEASARLNALLADVSRGEGCGQVFLVGAGPGDPDLLTLKALRLMYSADVVLYDRLVSPEILQRIRPDAEKIHVGKQRAQKTVQQESINDMLVRYAKQGLNVLRLKGGDPFIFGRGGEEIETLMQQGIPFQVVPGITAASGCASYAGIPLTHRDHAHSVRFLTGHATDDSSILDYPSLCVPGQTLVFYMSLQGLPVICEKLIAHGMPKDMPAAVVQQGTLAQQKVVAAPLSQLAEAVEQNKLEAPALTIIGEVVALRKRLNWYGVN